MYQDKHEYVNYRGYLEHVVDECQYCKKLAFIDRCKFAIGMALAILILCIFPEIVTWLPDKIMGKALGY